MGGGAGGPLLLLALSGCGLAGARVGLLKFFLHTVPLIFLSHVFVCLLLALLHSFFIFRVELSAPKSRIAVR